MNNIPFSNFPQNFNRNMNIVEPTYDQYIIKPPEKNITNGRIPHRLIIDSRDRNCNKYPNSNNFVYQLNKNYRDVYSIELVQGCIPYTGYIINHNNNKLFLQEILGQTVTISIPIGNYNESNLASTLENALNDPDNNLSNTYSVSINPLTNKFTISSDLSINNIFRLLNNCCICYNSFCEDCDSCILCRKNNCNKYIPGSISKKLGFDKVNFLYSNGSIINTSLLSPNTLQLNACNSQFTIDFNNGENISFANLPDLSFTIISINNNNEMVISGTNSNILEAESKLENSKIFGNKYTSNFVWDLDDEKYIIIEIEHFDILQSNNKNLDNSFGVIFFTVPHGQNNIIINGRLPRRGIEKFFNPPLSNLDRLRIKFLTADGNLYDFNGRDVVLEFEVSSLNQPGKYSTLITN
jgi:hypothetical protein